LPDLSSFQVKERLAQNHRKLEELSDQMTIESLPQLLRELFPHGHPMFADLTLKQLALHSEKNAGYAGGGDPLGNFERGAAIMRLYPSFPHYSPDAVAILYALKHFDRIMWDLNVGRRPSDESLADIAVYMNIIRCMNADNHARLERTAFGSTPVKQ